MHQLIRLLAMPALIAAGMLSSSQAQTRYITPRIEHEHFGTVRVVVPLTSADPEVFAFKLANLNNAVEGAEAWGGVLQAEMVLYGPGPKMLLQPDPATRATLDRLRAAGVRFKVCNNSLIAFDLNWRSLYQVQEADVVPSGFLEVGWRANQGWGVDGMN